jgi:hypothetical protein
MAENVLALIHGMVTEPTPHPHAETYARFVAGLFEHEPGLRDVLEDGEPRVIQVEWGHDAAGSGTNLRPDQRLAGAQRFVASRVAYDAVRAHPDELNVVLRGLRGDWNLTGARLVARPVREELIQFGLADAVYYTSEDGEREVRAAVYEQILSGLEPFAGADEVRLHVVSHSLGVAVAHDFLYGLFAPGHAPDFATGSGQGSARGQDLFRGWRARAQSGALGLGTFVSMASQLPLFVLRKQALVDRLHAGSLLDPGVIGVSGTHVQWVVFYDIDDILGFATRRLYEPATGIKEVQVDAGDLPPTAHTGYWKNGTVLEESAARIYENAIR